MVIFCIVIAFLTFFYKSMVGRINPLNNITNTMARLRIKNPQGLSQIKALGEPFDPNFHEAVRHGKGKEGIVIEELQKGYKLDDRVIRPAMVIVGSGEEEAQKEE